MSRDALGWRCKFAVVAPSTNTIVQPDMDSLRVKGVTNHYGRIHIPNMTVGNDEEQLAQLRMCPPRGTMWIRKALQGRFTDSAICIEFRTCYQLVSDY